MTPVDQTVSEKQWSEEQWGQFIRKGESPDQLRRELPLVGMPGFLLLRSLELLLDEDTNMFRNRVNDFERLMDTVIAGDYELGHYFFTSEEAQNVEGEWAPRYHLIVPEATVCYNNRLYIIGEEDGIKLQKYLQQVGPQHANNLLFFGCFDPATAAALQKWGTYLISLPVGPGFKGINREPSNLGSQMLQMSINRNWMENELLSTLRLDRFLYCNVYEARRDVTSPTKKARKHSLCRAEVFPHKMKKVSQAKCRNGIKI